MIRRTGTTRDGMGSRRHPTSTDGRWSARVLSELAGQRGCLILVIGDRREPASREPTLPDPLTQLTRLLTNLPGDVPPVFTVAISRRACSSCALAGELAEVRAPAGALATSAGRYPRPRDV